MKVAEVLELSQKTLEVLQESKVKITDGEFLPLYYDYQKMKGQKKSFIVTFLSEKYKISERKVYYLIKKLSEDCKKRAVG